MRVLLTVKPIFPHFSDSGFGAMKVTIFDQ